MNKNFLFVGMLGLVLGWCGAVSAASPGTGIVLSQALDAALSEAPERALASGREAQAQALQRHADALLPQAPSLALSAQGGAYSPNEPSGTYSEWVAGVELPLWRPGQAEVLRRLAAGMQDLADAERAALRLELAGLLREAGWDVLLAQARMEGMQRSLTGLRAAEKRVQRAVALGERARVDALTLAAEVADVELQVAAAQLAYEQAVAVWRVLSRQNTLPGVWREALVDERPIESLMERHPQALAARAAWQRAGSERQAGVLAAEGAPVLGIGAKQDRTPGSETLNAVVVTLSMPLPWETARGAAEAPLRYAELEAEVALAKQLRSLNAARAAARVALDGARRQAMLADERAKLERAALHLAQRQMDEGQLDVLDFVTVLRRVREAELAAALGRLEVERAVSRVNQAEGVI